MEERGIVIESGQGKARVRIQKSQNCEGCHGCLYQDAGEYVEAEVFDKIGAAPGDQVCIQTSGINPAKASLLLFGVPMLLLFIGYAAGAALARLVGASGSSQGFGIAGAAVFFVASFAVLLPISRRQTEGKNLRSEIVEVLDPAHQEH